MEQLSEDEMTVERIKHMIVVLFEDTMNMEVAELLVEHLEKYIEWCSDRRQQQPKILSWRQRLAELDPDMGFSMVQDAKHN